jgi:benzoate membrane transport protein
VLLLGATGLGQAAMQAVPMPIVMGMVAGVFLRFGVDLVRALHRTRPSPRHGAWPGSP